MADLTKIDVSEIDDPYVNDFTPIPEGEYLAKIVDSDTRKTRANDGEYVWLKFKICEGEYCNREIPAILNVKNKNIETSKIATMHLLQVSLSAGFSKLPNDTTMFHGIPMNIKVVCKKYTYNGEERIKNEIKKYTRRGAAPVAQQGAASEGGVDQHVNNAIDNL